MRRQTASALLVFGALSCGASLAHADERLDQISDADKHAAKELVKAGDAKFRGGDYAGALNDYRGADALMRVPTTGIEVARTLVLLGRLLEARVIYQRIVEESHDDDEPEPFRVAREQAATALEDLANRIPSIEVAVQSTKSSDVVVTIDGKTVATGSPVELDPGEHVVEAKAVGHRVAREKIDLPERAQHRTTLVLRPLADEAPPTPEPPAAQEAGIPPWTWIGVGVAGAGVVVGAITGGLSLSKASDLKEQAIGDNVYPESSRSLQQDSVTFAHVSTVSFAVAGAGVALATIGFVLFATESAGDAAAVRDGMLSWRF